ncbi:ComEC/Rec2 family competence protein [Chryseobacterium sp. Alg-005]|uniref:ComEC/Rec2 family competence protein n=1 Tax=Chryseobacterium sp. Alg-005 TaxID=3159516 RepID=UPI003555B544
MILQLQDYLFIKKLIILIFKSLSLKKQPLLILVICFILGIYFQDKAALSRTSVYPIAGSCVLISLSILFHSYFLYKIKPYLSGLLFFGLGIVLHGFNADIPVKNSVSSNQEVIFKISKKLNSTRKYKKYEAVINMESGYYNSVLYLPRNADELNFEHYYKAEAYVSQLKSPSYDFQFDYAKYLRRKGVYYQVYLSDEIFSVRRNDLTFGEKISQKRLEVLQNIDRTKISAKSKAFLKGLILADRTEIDEDTIQDFNRSGLMHFLTISGTHIVVIFGIFYFLFIQILPLSFRKSAIVLSLFFIWVFAGFIGFGNSVLRSCIMLTVYFIYTLLQRKPDLLHALSLSAFIILISDTHQIFDIGFQLSFIAVLGIFWLNQPILKYFPKQDHYFKRLLFNAVSISISAQLATLPLALLYFHQFSFISVIANFFIVPFSEIIIVFSFIMTAIIALGVNISVFNIIYDAIIQKLLGIIHWLADFEMLFFESIPMNGMEVLIAFNIIYWLRFAILRLNFNNSMRLMMAVFLFFIVRSAFNIIEYRRTEVSVSYFYENKVLLINNGGAVCFWINEHSKKDKIVQYIIKPYIASRRIHTFEIRIFPEHAQKVVYQGKIYDIN